MNLNKLKEELKKLVDDMKQSDLTEIRVYPEYFPFESKCLSTIERKAGVKGEQDLHGALKKLVKESDDSYLIYEIGKSLKKWLDSVGIKKLFEDLHKQAKFMIDNVNVKAYAPDFVLMNKNYGIFLIDSKNVNENNATDQFEKAMNQCKVFKSLLTIINEDYGKLPFYMGAYLPLDIEIKQDDHGTFVIKTLESVKDIFHGKFTIINEDIYNHLSKFLIGIKKLNNDSLLSKPLSTIDVQLKDYTTTEIKKKKSFIGKKVIISGPAGSGKTYHIIENIINILKPKEGILLVFEENIDVIYDKVKSESDDGIKLYKYLNDVNELEAILKPFERRNKDLKIRVYVYENNEKIDYCSIFINALESGYCFIDSMEPCLIYLKNLAKYLNNRDVIVEKASQKKFIDGFIDIKNEKCEIENKIKYDFRINYGKSIIFINSKLKLKEFNIKKALTGNLFSENIDILDTCTNSDILSAYKPNSISLCSASTFANNLIKKEIEKNKNLLASYIKYYEPCKLEELELEKLEEIILFNLDNVGSFGKDENKQTIVFRGKKKENGYYYDFIDADTANLERVLGKLMLISEKNKGSIHFKSCSQSRPGVFDELIDRYDFKLEREREENILVEIYKNSFFLIDTCYFYNQLEIFEQLKFFNSVESIHVFADDIMSSLMLEFNRINTNPETYKKIKTFIATLDVNQVFILDRNEDFLSCFNEFSLENLSIVYRHSKKIFEYLIPFYEYSSLLRHNKENVEHIFSSFDLFKVFIFEELKKSKLKIKPENKYIIKDVKCSHEADGEVLEIGVEKERIFEIVKKAIDEAFNIKKLNKNEIAVFIHHAFVPCGRVVNILKRNLNILKNKIEFGEKMNSNYFMKTQTYKRFYESFYSSTAKPFANDLFDKLNELYGDKILIQKVCVFNELVEDIKTSLRNIYSSEYKLVIFVDLDGCWLKAKNGTSCRFDYYFTLSRATVYLNVIYVKNKEYHSLYEDKQSRSGRSENCKIDCCSEKQKYLSKLGFSFCLDCNYFTCIYCNNSTQFNSWNSIDYSVSLHLSSNPECEANRTRRIMMENNHDDFFDEDHKFLLNTECNSELIINLELLTVGHLQVILNELEDYIMKKNESLLHELISFLRGLDMKHYSENYLSFMDPELSDITVKQFGLIALSNDVEESSLYRSISFLLNGNQNLCSDLKLGVLFILCEYKEYFVKILKEFNSEDSFEQLLEKIDMNNCNEFSLMSLSILLNKPINLFVFDLTNQFSYSEAFFIKDIHQSKQALNLAKNKNKFVPLLFTNEANKKLFSHSADINRFESYQFENIRDFTQHYE